MIENLFEDVLNRSLRLTVVGSGYVGLRTATVFTNAGFYVFAVDVRN